MDKFEELSKLIKEKGRNCGGDMYIFTNKLDGIVYEITLFDNDVIRSRYKGEIISLYKNNTATMSKGKREEKRNSPAIYSMLLTMILGKEEATKKMQRDVQSIKDTLDKMNNPENKLTYKDFKLPIFVGFGLVLLIVCKYMFKLF